MEAALQKLLVRSATDLDFRQQLLTNPQAAMEAHLGRSFNRRLNVRFIENTADATIVLPDIQQDALSDDELDAVSGGNVSQLLTLLANLH